MEKELSNKVQANGEIVVSSDSYQALERGLFATLKRSKLLSERWEEKQNKAPKVYRCKKCGKKYKTLRGIKKHFLLKNNECNSEIGYEQVPDIKVTSDDLVLEKEELAKVKKFNRIQEAAQKVALDMKQKVDKR